MKKIRFLITIMLLLFCQSVSVNAAGESDELTTIYEEFDVYAAANTKASSLDAATRQKLETMMRAAFDEFEETIDISSLAIPPSASAEVRGVLLDIVNSTPEYFYVGSGCSWTYNSYRMMSLTFYYEFTKEEGEAKVAAFREVLQEAISGVQESWSDAEKALYLHDWLVLHNTYDSTYSKHSSYNALVEGTSVCQGYAEAYQDLLEKVGIESKLISSTRANHMWNLVKIDGLWYHVDTTFDDPTSGAEMQALHSWFLKSSSYFSESSHGYSNGKTDWDSYYDEANNKKYDSFFWNKVDVPIEHDASCWYSLEEPKKSMYANGKPENGGKIVQWSVDANGNWNRTNEYVREYSRWDVINQSSSYWSGDYGYLKVVGNEFYYTTATELHMVRPAQNTDVVVYTLTPEQMQSYRIYGLKMEGDTLYLYLAEEPSGSLGVYVPYKAVIEFRNIGGELYYYSNDNWDSEKFGFVQYNGSTFFVAHGKLASYVSGLAQNPDNTDEWYYCAGGQVAKYTGLVSYDGEWFYVENGKLNTTLSKCVEYDGGLFFVGRGRIMREVSGLAQDPGSGEWYYFAGGQAQIQYTGLASYDGAWFYVKEGILADDYTGYVTYDGSQFWVENGMLNG